MISLKLQSAWKSPTAESAPSADQASAAAAKETNPVHKYNLITEDSRELKVIEHTDLVDADVRVSGIYALHSSDYGDYEVKVDFEASEDEKAGHAAFSMDGDLREVEVYQILWDTFQLGQGSENVYLMTYYGEDESGNPCYALYGQGEFYGVLTKQSESLQQEEDLRTAEESGASQEDSGSRTGYTDEEILAMAGEYYYMCNGKYPPAIEIDHADEKEAVVHVYEDMGDHAATLDWYFVDRTSGWATNLIGDTIDLTGKYAN